MSADRLTQVLAEVFQERLRQDAKWGDQSGNGDGMWYAILGEEFGEVGKALLESGVVFGGSKETPQAGASLADVRKELVQVAAVAVAWVEALDHRSAVEAIA